MKALVHLRNSPRYYGKVLYRPSRYFQLSLAGGGYWNAGSPSQHALCGSPRGRLVDHEEHTSVTCERCVQFLVRWGPRDAAEEARRVFIARQADLDDAILEANTTAENALLRHPAVQAILALTKPHLRGKILNKALGRLRKGRRWNSVTS